MSARYVIVATRARDRWFDLDAVRHEQDYTNNRTKPGTVAKREQARVETGLSSGAGWGALNPAGAPPLDWYLDDGTTPTRKERPMLGNAVFKLGDVFEQVATLPDASVDLIVSSPPFLALRSYLPAEHPDKHKEIGSEATPAEFIDTLLHLVAALDRVLAPHGSLVFELGDTYSGSERGSEVAVWTVADWTGPGRETLARMPKRDRSNGWPLDKSLTGIPTLFAWSLAYGRNLLTGQPSPAGQWRIRNVIPWCRPNPPVGALGDKWRPATSYVVVACRARDRWFDLDAVRTKLTEPDHLQGMSKGTGRADGWGRPADVIVQNPAGAPPLDWYVDPTVEHQPDDGIWVIPTAPYKGAHYATWPPELVRRLIECMCPREVCRSCGRPRRRITSEPEYVDNSGRPARYDMSDERLAPGVRQFAGNGDNSAHRIASTLGWTDCGHNSYRPGIVLDPFVGSGTTMAVAVRHGRDAIGIDLDSTNIALARARLRGLPLEVIGDEPADTWAADSLFAGEA